MRDYDDENYRTIAMVNPEILEHSEERYSEKEGCLSVPGESGEVKRWTWVKITFLDATGKPQTLKLTDLAARIVQHEIDHLDGVLFVDRVEENILFSL
jgi:peptide deformylase